MKVYSVDVKVYATVYIKAENEAEALATIRDQLPNSTIELEGGGDIEVSGLRYDDPELPWLSLSPAMTIVGPEADAVIELVYDPDGEGDADADE